MRSLFILPISVLLFFQPVLSANPPVNNPVATQQGSSKADVEITRQIRQAIVQNSSLSMSAKNIQIITIQGQVTLKGEVASVREQQEVVRAAQAVSGVQGLFNQTEIAKK